MSCEYHELIIGYIYIGENLSRSMWEPIYEFHNAKGNIRNVMQLAGSKTATLDWRHFHDSLSSKNTCARPKRIDGGLTVRSQSPGAVCTGMCFNSLPKSTGLRDIVWQLSLHQDRVLCFEINLIWYFDLEIFHVQMIEPGSHFETLWFSRRGFSMMEIHFKAILFLLLTDILTDSLMWIEKEIPGWKSSKNSIFACIAGQKFNRMCLESQSMAFHNISNENIPFK